MLLKPTCKEGQDCVSIGLGVGVACECRWACVRVDVGGSVYGWV